LNSRCAWFGTTCSPGVRHGQHLDAHPGDYERIIAGESTLLDISFRYLGVELAVAGVCLLVTLDGGPLFGMAFLIGPDLLLTNHHVLFADSGRLVNVVEILFEYERTFTGRDKVCVSAPGLTDTIMCDPVHDWSV
jgi:hypothetical protein